MKTKRRDFIKKSALGAATIALGANNLFASKSGDFFTDKSKSQAEVLDLDLLNDESAWSKFTPREELSPSFSKTSGDAVSGKSTFIISGNNNPDSVGCWLRKLPKLQKNHQYRLETSFRTINVDNINKSIRVIVIRNGREYVELDKIEKSKEWQRLSVEFSPNKDEDNLEIRLYLIEAGYGTVNWSNTQIMDLTGSYKPRLVNVAAISGRPSNVETSAAAIEFYCRRIDQIKSENLDLICLGENINVDRVPGDRDVMAEPIPGPSFARLAEKAREYNTYIATSLLERDGKFIHNTAILIDRKGGLVGKYRKTHLTIGEQLIKGLKPGDEYPVFQTDFGKVGLMICYDNHFPEVSRILAVKGADLIAFSNDSDGREWPNGASRGAWDPYIRTRAMDSHVAIVAAVNGGRSAIVNGSGEILATNKFSGEESGGIIEATLDLNASVINGTGRTIQKRYLLLRRFETYTPLLEHNWDFI